jgi:methionyl-tRNA synthetase
VLESARLAAYLLSPLIPNISTAIYQQLGYKIDFNDQSAIATAAKFTTHANWGTLSAKQPLSPPKPVFARLELPETLSSSQKDKASV